MASIGAQTEVGGQLKVGVDIGGTFTDLVMVDSATQEVYVRKELTTPEDPSKAVLEGLSRLLEKHDLSIAGLSQIVHATTLITNAIIERKGSKAGLITTRGFRDVLELGREAKYDLYDIFLPMPEPLVPRHLRKEVTERVDTGGQILSPLDLDEVDRVAEELVAAGCEGVAVSFLHAFQNPEHEWIVAERIRSRHPSLHISLSSDVAPEIREYERTNTTVANSYVQPLIARYLDNLIEDLSEDEFAGSFYMMLSNGGLTSVRDARDIPIRLLESGPAAGALIASFHANLGNEEHMVAFDMGGTTAKACVIENGQPEITQTFEAAREQRFKRGSGLPIRGASVELIEIGAGGGSIARVDRLGLLKVGPDSAGASPGPVCYDRGGTAPTVTDANLVLGYYNPDYFMGGEMDLNLRAARESIGELARRLDVSLEEAAWGIHNVVSEHMSSAARVHLAEKGHDPHGFSLLATGGAGPCHGARVAQKLRIQKVTCPPNAGVASAFGLLAAPPRIDLVRSLPTALEEADWQSVEVVFEDMKEQAIDLLKEAGVDANEVHFERAADMRYVGQGFEITVSLPDEQFTDESGELARESFERTYRETFARSLPHIPVEALTWRLVATGPTPSGEFISHQRNSHTLEQEQSAERESRMCYFPEWGEYRTVSVFDRYFLSSGSGGEGPAIIEERESTAIVPPQATWQVDEIGTLNITLKGQ